MALVKERKIGNTTIRIYDDSVVKTSEEVQAILQRCAEIAFKIEMEAKTSENEYKSI